MLGGNGNVSFHNAIRCKKQSWVHQPNVSYLAQVYQSQALSAEEGTKKLVYVRSQVGRQAACTTEEVVKT